MNIDEFLDRELSEIASPTDSAEKPEISAPQLKDFDASPLFENATANLIKGNLDEAEQSYAQLWRMLVQQKLKWNKELYGQLAVLSRQFSSILAQAYNDVKRKANQIFELISRARAAVKEGKREQPFKLYSEIQEINNSIPNVFFEEKRLLQEQIMEFYKELKNTTDNELLKRVSILVQEINQLMDKINNSIRANDVLNAIPNYNKCIELYNQVPEGFLRHKNSIGMKLLDIYKSLSIYAEISSLQKQLTQQPSQHPLQFQQAPAQNITFPTSQTGQISLSARKERAKIKMEKGLYDEAINEIQEALQLDPKDAEAKALHAKIKTLS